MKWENRKYIVVIWLTAGKARQCLFTSMFSEGSFNGLAFAFAGPVIYKSTRHKLMPKLIFPLWFRLLVFKNIIWFNLYNKQQQCEFKMFYSFIFKEGEGMEKEEWKINVCLPLVCPHQGLELQPRYLLWLGMEPATPCFSGQCSIHWATPSRARVWINK